MSLRTIVILLADLAVWYAFIYLWLYTLKHEVVLWQNTLALLALMVIGTALLYPISGPRE